MRAVEKDRPDGAGLGRGGDGALHERLIRLRTVDDKVRDAGKGHARRLHVRPAGRLHGQRQRHHRGRRALRRIRHDGLDAVRPADLGKDTAFPLRAVAQRLIKAGAAQGVAAKLTAHHLQPDLAAAARRGQKRDLLNAQLRQPQDLCRDARTLGRRHVRADDGRDVPRRVEHRDGVFSFLLQSLHGAHSVKWMWLLM